MTDNGSENFTIRVFLTKDDVTEAYWRYRRERALVFPILRALAFSIFFGIVAAFGLGAKVLMLAGPFAGALVAGLCLFGIPIAIIKLVLWAERTAFYWETKKIFHQPLTFKIAGQGVSVIAIDEQYHNDWSAIKEAFELPEMFIILTKKGLVLPIPKRFLDDQSEAVSLSKLLRAKAKDYSTLRGRKVQLDFVPLSDVKADVS